MDTSISLTDRADNYIELKGKIKTINATIKEKEEASELYVEIERAKQQLKDLKARRNLMDNELDELKNRKAEFESEAEALLMVIGQGIKDENPPLLEGMDAPAIVHNGYKFMLKDKLIVQKD